MRSWSIAGNLSAEWTASSKMDRLVYGKTFPLKRFSFFFVLGVFVLENLADGQNMVHTSSLIGF